MQGAGKQQEAQHAVHQGLIEIDLAQHAGDLFGDPGAGIDQIESDNRQRREITTSPMVCGRRKIR